MMILKTMSIAEFNDADLVAESLKGNREAFRQIVERYQTLISSLAYCATGNVGLSEDLAQETFVTAWNRLAELREPAKLRAWLCGINRFLISKAFRRLDHEPAHAAESLDAVAESPSAEPLPLDRVIGEEEKAILWRSIGKIPEIYREPLVLFYREQQSIETVARNLDLSEGAVKQRLARGRKLLHEQVLAFVEAALEKTKPDQAFALGVLAALPLAVTTAKAATATVALKGGSTLKAATSFAMLGAVLTASALFAVSLIGFCVFTGGCIGFMMSRSCRCSVRHWNQVASFWRLVAWAGLGIAAPVLPACLLLPRAVWCHIYYPGVTYWLGLTYPVVIGALVIWLAQWWRGLRHPETSAASLDPNSRKRFARSLALGMVVPFLITGAILGSSLTEQGGSTQTLSVSETQKLLAEHKDAKLTLYQYSAGAEELRIMLAGSEPRTVYVLPMDEAGRAWLAKGEAQYATQVEGRDFIGGGIIVAGLTFLCLFVAAMGGVLLAGRPWRIRTFSRPAADIQGDESRSKFAFKAFAVAMALVLLSVAFTLALMTSGDWRARRLTPAELPGVVAGMKGAVITLYQYRSGTREMIVIGERTRNLVARVDDATLALLAEKGVHYRTLVQGRDFGFGLPNRWLALCCEILLVGGAGFICWWASRKMAAVAASVILLLPCLWLGLTTPWHSHWISAAEAGTLIAAHPAGEFEVLEFQDGSMNLFFIPQGHDHRHALIAPADDSTTALLTANKIEFKNYSQGRDFGLGMPPTRGAAVLWIFVLTMAASLILWWAWRKPLAANGTSATSPARS